MSTDQERPERRPAYGAGIPGTNAILRMVFGIFMVIVYVGMGVLLLINFFDWSGDWAWTRYVVGVVLVIYGLWRAYRQIKGIDDPYRDSDR